MDCPERGVGHLQQLRGAVAMAHALEPVGAEQALECPRPLGREKRRHVHAVGHVIDRIFLGGICGQSSRSICADTPPWMRDTPL